MMRVRIDSLVLDGLDVDAAAPVARALRERLARALVAEGLGGQLDSVGHIDAGAIEVSPGDSPSTIGSRIALAVHRGLTSGARD